MARVKRGIVSHKRRENTLAKTKGFHWGRKSKYRLAKDALRHAWEYSFRDRKAKKRMFRQNWQRTIASALEHRDINYSRFIAALKKSNIQLDRKILAELAKTRPQTFQEIVTAVKKSGVS